MKTTKNTEERFWAKVQKAGKNECWEWKGAKQHGSGRHGKMLPPYGEFKLNGRVVRAHRVAWLLTNGEIPEEKEICHKCDNRLCCNPSHLFVGTHKENMQDMFTKGRNKGAIAEQPKINMGDVNQKIHAVLLRMKNSGCLISLSLAQREVFGNDDPRGGKHFVMIKNEWKSIQRGDL